MIVNPDTTLYDFLHDVYLPCRGDLSDGHVYQVEVTLRALNRWLRRTATLRDFTNETIRAFLAAYRKGNSPSTTNSKRCQLLALWKMAYEEEYVENLYRKIPRYRDYRRAPEAWSVIDVGRVIAASDCQRGAIGGIPAPLWFRSYLLALFDSGERRGAMLQARTVDLDLEERMLYLPAEVRKDRTDRWHPLAPDTVAAIRKIYDPQREYVWPWPYTREAFDKRLRKLLTAARVRWGRGRGGSLHKMRRTSGTLVEAAGGDGSRHLGNTRAVFESHYLDPRAARRHQLDLLPRPSA